MIALPRSLIVLSLLGAWVVPAVTPARRYEHTQIHMGMPVRIVLYVADEVEARAAARAAFERIAQLDGVMSDYRPDSELRALERRAGEWVPVSQELFSTIARALEIARATDGAFDPSVAPLVALWREARASGRLPDRAALDATRARVGWRQVEADASRRAVRLREGVRLDLGGIAKGYILQQALHTIQAGGVSVALLEAGGDIVVGEAPPGTRGWHLEAPGADQTFVQRASRLTNAALATSGSTAQFVEIGGVRYSHVIDPRTGLGVTHDYVARAIAADASTADALATALLVAGPERAGEIRARFPDVIVSLSRSRASQPARVARSISSKLRITR